MSDEADDKNLPAERDDKGRFLAGNRPKGGPGRPKGSRNWIVEQRMAFESALRTYIAQPDQARKFLKAIDRLVDIAANTDGTTSDKDSVSAIKILTEHFMNTTSRPSDEEGGKNKAPSTIRVVFEGMPGSTPRAARVEIAEGEFTEIEDAEGTDPGPGSE